MDDESVLASLARIAANSHARADLFNAVETVANDRIGHKLFTLMAFNAEMMQVQRLYSSDPVAYPPGGAKEKRDTPWGRQVLESGEHFIGKDRDDISAYFNDASVMFDLGLHSILNVPIRLNGQTLGTMNLCHDSPGYYQESHLPWGLMLTGVLSATLVSHLNSPNDNR